jgi:hypothetical protein
MYAANELVTNGERKFPKADDIESDGDFSRILDEEPEGWVVEANGGNNNNKVDFKYTDPDPDVVYTYECPVGGDEGKYELTKQ